MLPRRNVRLLLILLWIAVVDAFVVNNGRHARRDTMALEMGLRLRHRIGGWVGRIRHRNQQKEPSTVAVVADPIVVKPTITKKKEKRPETQAERIQRIRSAQ